MTKKVRIMGLKAIPIWLMVLALVTIGAGAAAGTVLAGKVVGEMPVAVSQALLNGVPDWQTRTEAATSANETNMTQQVFDHIAMVALPNRSFGAVADDNTAFQAAAEVATGDWAVFYLPMKNASENDLVGLLTLNVPEGLEVEVYAPGVSGASGNVTEVVRIGLNTWKFKLDKDADYDTNFADPNTGGNSLAILVSVDDILPPGYYTIDGQIKQIGY